MMVKLTLSAFNLQIADHVQGDQVSVQLGFLHFAQEQPARLLWLPFVCHIPLPSHDSLRMHRRASILFDLALLETGAHPGEHRDSAHQLLVVAPEAPDGWRAHWVQPRRLARNLHGSTAACQPDHHQHKARSDLAVSVKHLPDQVVAIPRRCASRRAGISRGERSDQSRCCSMPLPGVQTFAFLAALAAFSLSAGGFFTLVIHRADGGIIRDGLATASLYRRYFARSGRRPTSS